MNPTKVADDDSVPADLIVPGVLAVGALLVVAGALLVMLPSLLSRRLDRSEDLR